MQCLPMASLKINIEQSLRNIETGFWKSVLLHLAIRDVTAQLERHCDTTIILTKGCTKKSLSTRNVLKCTAIFEMV